MSENDLKKAIVEMVTASDDQRLLETIYNELSKSNADPSGWAGKVAELYGESLTSNYSQIDCVLTSLRLIKK